MSKTSKCRQSGEISLNQVTLISVSIPINRIMLTLILTVSNMIINPKS